MSEVTEYIKSVKERMGLKSYTELGKLIGKKQSYMSMLMNEHLDPSEDVLMKIAETAGDRPEYALLLIHKQKSSTATRPYWDTLLKKVVNMSLCGAIGIGISEISRQLCILC